jgi:hypothetical protein
VRSAGAAAFAQLEMRKVLATVLREVDARATTMRDERVVRRGRTLKPEPGARVRIAVRMGKSAGATAVPVPGLNGAPEVEPGRRPLASRSGRGGTAPLQPRKTGRLRG